MRVLWFKIYPGGIGCIAPAESKEMNAGAADGSDEAEQETTEQQSADTKKKEGEDGGAEAVIYNCPSCGAEIVTDATTAATFCYYCHNPSCLENGWKESIFQTKSFPLKFPKRSGKTLLRVCWKEKICSKGIF